MRTHRLSAACLALGLGLLGGGAAPAAPTAISATPRGAVVETARYRVEFRDGVLVALLNKLTDEQYLDTGADLEKVVPHLPSGLGTQQGEAARAAAETLYKWPWWEHPNDKQWPNQHYADARSRCEFRDAPVAGRAASAATLTYTNLTDGAERFTDETFTLSLEIDTATGDLLVTPGGKSPRPGVYAANLTLAPLTPAVTTEAPIADGLHITRENTGNVLWMNKWPDYWQYGFVAFNGWKKGAVAIWAQDSQLRYYKNLLYLKNNQGLSFALSMMNIPPFEKLKDAQPGVPWRIQAFDTGWAQAAERYRAWRDAKVKLAPRSDFAKQTSFIASVPGAQENWLKNFARYTEPWQGRAAAFLCSIRGQSFDRNHADNTPYKGFKDDTAKWRAAGTYGMAYLQPMLMWGPFPDEAKMANPAREKAARKLHEDADTRGPFQQDPDARIPYVDQHHLGHPGWQRWFLDWIHEWCKDYQAQGIYHDQSYHAPVDRRGLAIGGMTAPEGMADYFYKAATENPGTFHGTEMVTEPNAVGVDNAIGSGYHWGTAPNMRLARAYDSSPVTAALCYPHTVLWSFVRLRGDSTWDLRERRMQEARGQIAGAIDGPYDYNVSPNDWPKLCNTPWHDRTRDVAFLQYGLRPYYPSDYRRDVLSYFRGAKGEEFRYERMPWGSRFVQLDKAGKRQVIYAVATGVQAVPQAGVGIANWLVYNDDDPTHTWNRTGPAGLHPERWYVLDPSVKRPPVWFSTVQGYGPSFYEAYVEDSGCNDYFAFLKLRTIGNLSAVTGWESLVLHSPTPPVAVYVNGKKTEVKPKAGTQDQYPMSVKAPADIVVLLRQAPALPDLHQATLLRVTEAEHPVDYYRPELISAQANGGLDEAQRPVIQDAAVSPFGFQFGGRKHLYLPVAAPAGSKGGKYRIHLPLLEKYGQKWNHRIEAIEANFQPLAISHATRQKMVYTHEGAIYERDVAVAGNLTMPAALDIPLAPGEVKLLSLSTQPLVAESFGDFKKVTVKLALEWVEGDGKK
jgi:hypothetical protein